MNLLDFGVGDVAGRLALTSRIRQAEIALSAAQTPRIVGLLNEYGRARAQSDVTSFLPARNLGTEGPGFERPGSRALIISSACDLRGLASASYFPFGDILMDERVFDEH